MRNCALHKLDEAAISPCITRSRVIAFKLAQLARPPPGRIPDATNPTRFRPGLAARGQHPQPRTAYLHCCCSAGNRFQPIHLAARRHPTGSERAPEWHPRWPANFNGRRHCARHDGCGGPEAMLGSRIMQARTHFKIQDSQSPSHHGIH